MGRKLDQIKLGESSEKLHYVVNSPSGASGLGGDGGGGGGGGDQLLAKHVRPVSASGKSSAAASAAAAVAMDGCGEATETIEFLVVNDDLILQRSKSSRAKSQPELADGTGRKVTFRWI